MSDSPPAAEKSCAVAGAIVALLRAKFPRTFFRYQRKPLAIGIREELLQVLDGISEDELAMALADYVAIRVDLSGEPAGEVSEGEAEFAQRKIRARSNGSGHPGAKS